MTGGIAGNPIIAGCVEDNVDACIDDCITIIFPEEAMVLNRLTKRIDSKHFEKVFLISNILTRNVDYKSVL